MTAVGAIELYSAILSENASLIVNIAKKYGTNSMINGSKSKPSKVKSSSREIVFFFVV